MVSSIPEYRMVASVNNLLCLTSDLNSWTSSAALGALSSSPSGVYPHQNIPYPCTNYVFNEIFILVMMLRIYW